MSFKKYEKLIFFDVAFVQDQLIELFGTLSTQNLPIYIFYNIPLRRIISEE